MIDDNKKIRYDYQTVTRTAESIISGCLKGVVTRAYESQMASASDRGELRAGRRRGNSKESDRQYFFFSIKKTPSGKKK